jgi:hypothetical protein
MMIIQNDNKYAFHILTQATNLCRKLKLQVTNQGLGSLSTAE